MQIFLTYASEQKAQAEAIAFSLRARGHNIFLDKDDLPPGKSYDEQIETAIANSDYLLFLISPDSVRPGRYTLTELDHARRKWRSPDGYILPVMVAPTDLSLVPKFLSAVTILEPKGNIAAEVAAHVRETDYRATRHLVAYFAIAGAVSGLVSGGIPNLPGANLLIPFGGVIDIYPAIYFALGLCALFAWKFQATPVQLAMVVVAVQIAWQAAAKTAVYMDHEFAGRSGTAQPLVRAPAIMDSAVAAETGLGAGQSESDLPAVAQATEQPTEAEPDASPDNSASADEQQTGGFPLGLITGFFAGSIGGLGTWLAGVFAYRRLLSLDAAIFTTAIGGAGGLLMMSGSLLLLYVAWQSAVAASLARGIVRHR